MNNSTFHLPIYNDVLSHEQNKLQNEQNTSENLKWVKISTKSLKCLKYLETFKIIKIPLKSLK